MIAPRGSLVLWDSRLPHATCEVLAGWDSREVVYTGFLPSTEINRRFVAAQAQAVRANVYPMYGPQGEADRDWVEEELTPEQRRLLGLGLGE